MYKLPLPHALERLMLPKLRPYQEEAVKAFMEKNKNGKGILNLAVGLGKTFIALAIAKELFKKGEIEDVIVVVPSTPLAMQWRNVIMCGGSSAGLYISDIRRYKSEILITTYAAVYRTPSLFRKYDLAIFDECHKLMNPDYIKILDHSPKWAIGLTGTIPEREYAVKVLEVMPVVYTMSYVRGVKEGWLARVELHPIKVSVTPDEEERIVSIRRRLHDLFHDLAETYGTTDLGVLKKVAGGTEDYEELMTTIGAYRRMLCMIEDKLYTAADLIADNVPRKILVFNDVLDALKTLKNLLAKRGIRSEIIHGEMPTDERMRILKGWGRSYSVLMSAKVLELGIDVPDLMVGIFVGNSKSLLTLMQRLGRFTRRARVKDRADIYYLYTDFEVDFALRVQAIFSQALK